MYMNFLEDFNNFGWRSRAILETISRVLHFIEHVVTLVVRIVDTVVSVLL